MQWIIIFNYIKKRLENSAKELAYGREEGNFDLFLVNDDLNTACLSLIEKVKGWYPHIKESADHYIQSNDVSTCVSFMKQLGNLCYWELYKLFDFVELWSETCKLSTKNSKVD